jgi:hypothetical protein
MIHIDHISIHCVDLYEASDRLRKESGLGFYDGGWFPANGSANKIFPIGGPNYIEVGSVTNPGKQHTGTPMADYMTKAMVKMFSMASVLVSTAWKNLRNSPNVTRASSPILISVLAPAPVECSFSPIDFPCS